MIEPQSTFVLRSLQGGGGIPIPLKISLWITVGDKVRSTWRVSPSFRS